MSTHFYSSVRATRTLSCRPTRGWLNRVPLMTLLACAVMFCAQLAWAQTAPTSDSLFVNYGLAQNVFIQVPEPAVEGGQEGTADVQVSDGTVPPLQPGYILVFEPDGSTLSDILVSYTGSSLQFF